MSVRLIEMKKIKFKELAEEIKRLNDSGLLKKEIKTVGKTKEVLVDLFVEAVQSIPDDVDGDWTGPEETAEYYMSLLETDAEKIENEWSIKEENTEEKESIKEENTEEKESIKEENTEEKESIKEENTEEKESIKEENTEEKESIKEENTEEKESIKEENTEEKESIKEENTEEKESIKEEKPQYKEKRKRKGRWELTGFVIKNEREISFEDLVEKVDFLYDGRSNKSSTISAVSTAISVLVGFGVVVYEEKIVKVV